MEGKKQEGNPKVNLNFTFNLIFNFNSHSPSV